MGKVTPYTQQMLDILKSVEERTCYAKWVIISGDRIKAGQLVAEAKKLLDKLTSELNKFPTKETKK